MAEDRGSGNRNRPRASPYRQWQESEGVPIHRAQYVSDLSALPVGFWPRLGQQGALVNLADQEMDDSWLLEIRPGEQTEPQRHLFESLVYVLDGRGATTVWQPGQDKQTVEWQRGSLFSPPLNCHYQHFNLDGDRPARLFAVTNGPMVMNLYRNTDFVFNAAYVFSGRYAGQADYFTSPGEEGTRGSWKTNFVPDVRAFALRDQARRGAGGTGIIFSLADNAMAAHISEFPPGTYKKAHRHNVGAHVVILGGEGYSLLWLEGEAPRRVDWRDGAVISPRDHEFHQHFNVGGGLARYLALRLGDADLRYLQFPADPTSGGEWQPPWIDQIEYEDEDPRVYAWFREECERRAAPVVLPPPAYRAPRSIARS